jgi:hypothetical protein
MVVSRPALSGSYADSRAQLTRDASGPRRFQPSRRTLPRKLGESSPWHTARTRGAGAFRLLASGRSPGRLNDAGELPKRSQTEKRNGFNARPQNGGQGQRTDERASKLPKRSQTEKLRDFKGAGCRCIRPDDARCHSAMERLVPQNERRQPGGRGMLPGTARRSFVSCPSADWSHGHAGPRRMARRGCQLGLQPIVGKAGIGEPDRNEGRRGAFSCRSARPSHVLGLMQILLHGIVYSSKGLA